MAAYSTRRLSYHVPGMRIALCGICLASTLYLAACGGGPPPIDWEARQQTYSYTDAVADYGEPRGCTPEATGGRICSWEVGGIFTYADQLVLKFDAAGLLVSQRTAKIQ